MWVHPRMRSTTNFFLTNLAIADFCVTVFCVYQNLSLYLAQTWVFGDFLCKMYNFVNYLSYTASVMILVVNCVERYVAIMCPFRAKTLLRHRNLVMLLVVVWAGSGVYCCPRLLYFRAGSHELPGSQYTEVICLPDRELYDSRTFDTINFVLLYVMPLSVMSLLYWRIGRYLWVNGRQIEEARRSTQAPMARPSTLGPQAPCCLSAIKENAIKNQTSRSRSREDGQVPHSAAGSSSSIGCYSTAAWRRRWRHPGESISMGPYHSERLIRTWRKVVKLLVAVVLCFALCNLPFHLRKMLTYYHPAYKPTTDAALMFTPLSNLLMYLNSALNPIVYSFMSHNFRACVRDVLTRYTRRGMRRHLSGPQRPAAHPQRHDPPLHILAAAPHPHPHPHPHTHTLTRPHPCSMSHPRLDDHHP
ncbi:trissin receptor-like isoform X2 [Portunus trituberculatus]|nr:trissin receptor-like isoform X2 [Portunus trituberculatus]